jgi:FixJ family two-component response regulator
MTGITRHRPSEHRRPNILWIDDNIQDYHLHVSNLAISGKQVFCCTEAGDFLNLAREYLVDIAIIDLKLSGFERGEQLIEHLSQNHRNTRIIVHSNHVPLEEDFSTDSAGTLFLSADANEQSFLPNEETKIDRAVNRILETASKNIPKEPTPPREILERVFDRSWQNLTGYGKNALQRILPALALVNVVIAISVNWDRDLVIFRILLSNKAILTSFTLFALVAGLVLAFGPREIRKIPSRSLFIDTKLVMYENDPEFAKSINNQMEKLGVDFEHLKPFDRLSTFYQFSNVLHPRLRALIFLSFWLAVVLISMGTISNLFEFSSLLAND